MKTRVIFLRFTPGLATTLLHDSVDQHYVDVEQRLVLFYGILSKSVGTTARWYQSQPVP